MFGHLDKYLAVFFTGLAVTYLLTPLMRKWAIRLGAVDQPNERRPHRQPTPRGGGVAVVLGVHAACLTALAFPWPRLAGELDIHWWAQFALASLVLLVVGVVDDLRGLRPLVKLSGQALAALLVWLSGTRFDTFLGYELPPALDCLLVVLWIVAIINAFNLIDGLDGLATGLALISAAGLGGMFLLGHLPGNVLVLMGLMGACLGFLRYNLHPASIFLGDTGSMFLGFTLGAVSLRTFSKSTFLLSMGIPLLVLGVPLFDEVLAVWRRSVRMWLTSGQSGARKHRGIMEPDLEHLHHRLLKAGLSIRRVTIVLVMLNAVLVMFGLLITVFQSHAAGIFLIAFLAVVYVVMRHLAVIELRDTGQVILSGLHRPTHATFKSLSYPVWDMLCMAGAVALAMWAFEEPKPGFWRAWFFDLPIWVTPTFSLLAASRVYVTSWNRARLLDVLMLLGTLVVGLVLSLSIALLIDPSGASKWFVRALVVGGLSHPAIIGVRLFYRLTEEIVHCLRNRSQPSSAGRVILYGAGGRCQLFLKERGFNNSSSFDARAIIGLIDDEPSLHGQWAYGYKVLGGLKDLPNLVARNRISGVIITAGLKPESHAAVQALALHLGFNLSEWRFESRQLVLSAPEPSPALKPLGARVSDPAGPPLRIPARPAVPESAGL
jgi:UDP-N-acetylmuramyl pentapeptide phosphotransferase/UDP-N-acetylglucosamine-1-phosphate transferase